MRQRLTALRLITKGDLDLSFGAHFAILRGFWYLRRGDIGGAFSIAERIRRDNPLSATPLALLALSLLEAGRQSEALACAREASQKQALGLLAAKTIGAVAVRAGDDELAAHALAIAHRQAPSDSETALKLAEAQLALGLLGQSLRTIETALTRGAAHPRYLALRGVVLGQLERWEECVECLAPLVRAGMQRSDVTRELSFALAHLGRENEAFAIIDGYKGERDRRLRLQARLCQRLGRIDEALRIADEAVRSNPSNTANHRLRATLLTDSGRTSEALNWIDEACRDSSDPSLHAYRDRLHVHVLRAESREASGTYADARRWVKDALKAHDSHPQCLLLIASTLQKIGEIGEALNVLSAANGLDEDGRIQAQIASLRGLLRTLSGSWLPNIEGFASGFQPTENRILHLLDRSLPHRQSGGTIRSINTMLAQREAGLDPVVATRLGIPILDGSTAFELEEDVQGVKHHRLLLSPEIDYDSIPKDVYVERYAELAAALVDRLRPAIIHPATSYLNGLVGLALKRHFGLPLVYEMRGFLEDTWAARREGTEKSEFYERRRAIEDRCMQGADRVVTLADVMRSAIIERGIDPDRIVVIPNAVDVEKFRPRPRDPHKVQALGLEGLTVLGYVSGLNHYEGVDVLLRAIAILRRRGLAVGGLIVGEGVLSPSLHALARELGIASSVRFTGSVPHEDIASYYSLIDLFVVPRRNVRVSHYVTPLKPFEAMAMGLPIVVSDVPALREVVPPGERGLIYEPDDPEHLAAVSEHLIFNDHLRRELGARARDWVVRERTWKANGIRYKELYDELLAASCHRRTNAG